MALFFHWKTFEILLEKQLCKQGDSLVQCMGHVTQRSKAGNRLVDREEVKFQWVEA